MGHEMTLFTQEDAERIRSEFESFVSAYSTERIAVEHVEPQGKFMNVFMAHRVRRDDYSSSPFSAFAALDDALNMALSARGWKLVQALVLREEGDVLRFRVRIEKNEIKPNNER